MPPTQQPQQQQDRWRRADDHTLGRIQSRSEEMSRDIEEIREILKRHDERLREVELGRSNIRFLFSSVVAVGGVIGALIAAAGTIMGWLK